MEQRIEEEAASAGFDSETEEGVPAGFDSETEEGAPAGFVSETEEGASADVVSEIEEGAPDLKNKGLEEFASGFLDLFGLARPDLKKYSPLTLAYIGDAVYELVIRSYVTCHGNAPVEKLHHRASDLVNAHVQSELSRILSEELTEEELAVFKRGRNARSYTKAKNATTHDYRRATGLEALVGYLFLDGQYERLVKLIHDGLEKLELI